MLKSEKVYKCLVQDCTLGIRMCSKELLLWKYQKGLTQYPMTLYKRESTADIFLWIFHSFFGQAISLNRSKPLIVKGFYLVRMSNDYCFRRAAQGQLSHCNRRNTSALLRALGKSHEGLKRTKVFTCGCSGRNLQNFWKFTGKSLCWTPFIVKLQPGVVY